MHTETQIFGNVYMQLAGDVEQSVLNLIHEIEKEPCITSLLKGADKGADSQNGTRKRIHELYKEIIDSSICKREFLVSWVGGFSSGKTTIVNTILEYPLLPVSPVVMTGATTKMKYAKHPYLKVLDENGDQLLEVSRPVDDHVFQMLQEFFCRCVDKPVSLQNAKYFRDFSGKIVLNPKDIRQNIMLLGTLFIAYVNQNQDQSILQESHIEVLDLRSKVFKTCFNEKITERAERGDTFMLEIGWDTPLLEGGMCFLDLPGLDSVVIKNNQRLHDEITQKALNDSDAIIVTFEAREFTGETRKALESWLQSAKIKVAGAKDFRIIGLINKIDSMPNPEDIESIMLNIQTVFNTNSIPSVPMFGISALLASEERFYHRGFTDIRNLSKYMNMMIGADGSNIDAKLQEARKESRFEDYEKYMFAYASRSKVIASREAIDILLRFIQSIYYNYIDSVRAGASAYKFSVGSYEQIIEFFEGKGASSGFIYETINVLSKSIQNYLVSLNEEITEKYEEDWSEHESRFINQLEENMNESLREFMSDLEKRPSGAAIMSSRMYLHKNDNQNALDQLLYSLKKHGIDKFTKELSGYMSMLTRELSDQFHESDRQIARLYKDFYNNNSKTYNDISENIEKNIKNWEENEKRVLTGQEKEACILTGRQLLDILSEGESIESIIREVNKGADEDCRRMVKGAIEALAKFHAAYYQIIEDCVIKNCQEQFFLTKNEYIDRKDLAEYIDDYIAKNEDYAEKAVRTVKNNLDSVFFSSSTIDDVTKAAVDPTISMRDRSRELVKKIFEWGSKDKAVIVQQIENMKNCAKDIELFADNMQGDGFEIYKSKLKDFVDYKQAFGQEQVSPELLNQEKNALNKLNLLMEEIENMTFSILSEQAADILKEADEVISCFYKKEL